MIDPYQAHLACCTTHPFNFLSLNLSANIRCRFVCFFAWTPSGAGNWVSVMGFWLTYRAGINGNALYRKFKNGYKQFLLHKAM